MNEMTLPSRQRIQNSSFDGLRPSTLALGHGGFHNTVCNATQQTRYVEPMMVQCWAGVQGFFIVHSTIGSTTHSSPLNSLGYCICTTSIRFYDISYGGNKKNI